MSYLEKNVGVYKKSEKGFYRQTSMTLWEVINHPSWDAQVVAYRETKTKETPKGDRDLKNKIMAYMPAGDYGRDVPRKVGNPLKSETNLVQLDFDQPISKKKLQTLFEKYPWIAVAQVSCGGGGFYFLVHTEKSKDYDGYFWALVELFKTKEKLHVDVAVSSINEIRFVSLTKELLWRDNASVWVDKIEHEPSPMERVSIPLDGDPVALPDEVKVVHYVDLIAWAGKNNANGVPLEKALKAFPMERIGQDSHLYKKEKVVQEVITNIYQRYAEQHGEAVVTAMMLEGVSELDLPEIKFDKSHTAEFNALRIVEVVLNKYQFKTDHLSDITYRYCGTHWEKISDADVRHFLSRAAIKCGYGAKSMLTSFRTYMFENLKDQTRASFDTPLTAFNLNNGVLVFKDGSVSLEDHSDTYGFTYKLDYEYKQSQPAPIFQAFIDRVLPDGPTQEMLFDYIGSGFLPLSMKMEKTLILLGSGANGKSTIVDLLTSLFGEAVGRFNLERLTDQNESPKEARNIYNKVFGVCSEGKFIKDVNLWKGIVSKEIIDVKYLYKDSFQTNNYGRLITCMNEMPNIESVQGSMRRVLVIGMGTQIPEHEQDPSLGSKLKEERSAILELVVKGYRRTFAKNGLIEMSAAARAVTTEVIDDQDQVLGWVRAKGYFPMPKIEGTRPREEKYHAYIGKLKLHAAAVFKTQNDCYSSFREWCKEEGNDYPVKKRKFLTRLKELHADRIGHGEGRFIEVLSHNGTREIVLGMLINLIPPGKEKVKASPKPKKKDKDVPF